MSTPQNSCRALPQTQKKPIRTSKSKKKTLLQAKNSPLGPQKVKNYPKINSKSKVRVERSIEN